MVVATPITLVPTLSSAPVRRVDGRGIVALIVPVLVSIVILRGKVRAVGHVGVTLSSSDLLERCRFSDPSPQGFLVPFRIYVATRVTIFPVFKVYRIVHRDGVLSFNLSNSLENSDSRRDKI